MKRFLLLALCALFACDAGARTLYVDAKRPNNNGHGLSKAKAKKTIQAAINVAKKGDTILVYPGTYSPIKTDNLKVSIKSVKGNGKTTIARPKKRPTGRWVLTLALLGRTPTGRPSEAKGKATALTGFTLNGNHLSCFGVSGGSVASCRIVDIGGPEEPTNATSHSIGTSAVAFNCALSSCRIEHNDSTYCSLFADSTFMRCRIEHNNDEGGWALGGFARDSTFVNTLISGNRCASLHACTVVNCTIAGNVGNAFSMASTKAFNSVLYGLSEWTFKKSYKNKLKNCYRGRSPKFAGTTWVEHDEWGYTYVSGRAAVEWETDDGEEYGTVIVFGVGNQEVLQSAKDKVGKPDASYRISRYEKITDHRLAKGSPCIDKGKLTKAQKKLVGTKDLAGNKRIKGKSVDIGCYEY